MTDLSNRWMDVVGSVRHARARPELFLPVGGIKEKVVAAARAGLKRVIMLPARNRRDYDEIPDEARNQFARLLAIRNRTSDDHLRTVCPSWSDCCGLRSGP